MKLGLIRLGGQARWIEIEFASVVFVLLVVYSAYDTHGMNGYAQQRTLKGSC